MSGKAVEELYRFCDAEILAPLDVHFAIALARITGELDRFPVLLGAALACRAPRLGHIYADLGDPGSIRFESEPEGEQQEKERPPWPDPGQWIEVLQSSPLLQVDPAPRPLVLDGQRLYLHRYWQYQQRLAEALKARAVEARDVDLTACRDALAMLFPEEEGVPEPNLQRVAAAIAAVRGLAVITGGPGTGKTTTVVKLLALLALLGRSTLAGTGQNVQSGRLRVELAAPTGKAAARMAESIRSGKDSLELAGGIADAINPEASTIHRLLGYQPSRPTRLRHHRGNPLPVDVLVVDEASMIPLTLMAKLVDAVPARARLVLLGDHEQLASVEAGTVLADLCSPEDGRARGYSKGVTAVLDELGVGVPPALRGELQTTGIWDSVVHLEHSFRFTRHGGIARIAAAVNAGQGDVALQLLRASTPEEDGVKEIQIVEGDEPGKLRRRLKKIVLEQRMFVTEATSELEALETLGRFCVLCAHRHGPLGALKLNAEIERWLANAGVLSVKGEWYDGRPVMVTSNDYQVGLFNGDIGVVLSAGEGTGHRVVFPSTGKRGFREVSPGRLPPHDTVFAMTVHKSQGSEFDTVVVVLPASRSKILTRELLYTAITRARRQVTVIGPADVLTRGIKEQVQRASGLRKLLWEG